MYGRYKRMTGESNTAMGGKVIGWGNDYDPSHVQAGSRPMNREVATGKGLVRCLFLSLCECLYPCVYDPTTTGASRKNDIGE